MTVLLLVEDDELSRQALTLARGLGDVEAVAAAEVDLPVDRLGVADAARTHTRRAPGPRRWARWSIACRPPPSSRRAPTEATR